MTAQVLLTQQQVAAIQYALLGKNTFTGEGAFDSIAVQFRTGTLTQEQYITNLLSSSAGQALYAGKSDLDILKSVYSAIYGTSPSDSLLQGVLGTTDLNTAIYNAISGLLYYNGFDNSNLTAQQSLDATLDKMMYQDFGTSSWNTWSVDLASKEKIAATYLTFSDRSTDMSGLAWWTKALSVQGNTFSVVLAKIINSSEAQKQGANLSGDAFIKHVYHAIYGADPSTSGISAYQAYGSDKAAITNAIISDLRNSLATDNATVTLQHAFENSIGTGLLYKTGAILTATAAGGNATGTVNTNTSHQLTNAETAVLTNVQLNANAATIVNLKFADHLVDLEIGGGSAATINLSDNGVNPGVNVTVNNGSVILNASSGADKVLLTTDAVVASATGQFNLGAGNDSLKWLGNGISNGANTVSTNITANGGLGVDTISANLLTKNIAVSAPGLTRTVTISTNASQFTNFEKVDLAGYIGKATLSGSTSGATTPTNHTFDFGILTGNASNESGLTGTLTTKLNQPAASTIGSQGFVLSGLANQVHVINAAGGSSAQLEVTDNATAASSVDITFLKDAVTSFGINFTATSNTDVNAGSLALHSSSTTDILGNVTGPQLTTLNIASGGIGNFSNTLTLADTNTQVTGINVSGDHVLNLNVGSGFSNIHNVNAASNTAGLNLDLGASGTGDGIIVQLLKILPLSAVTIGVLDTVLGLVGLGLNKGYHVDVTGTSSSDHFAVQGNTVVAGGNGANQYVLKSSTVDKGVTVSDFNSAKDTITDNVSGLTINNDTSHTAVTDYGYRTSDQVDALLGTLVGGVVGGVAGLLANILGLQNGSLTQKVGVASVVWSGQSSIADSYLIIDNNNNHNLDSSDTIVFLSGQNHQQLVDTLHYA
ncbi:DUF4214 domain-containing protein [Klebsiella aerogenes]|uniref:beta strand repeat-containing protein n=1 Tax=Klebsiella aerogenes TaxID=548 RepID=UPI0018665C44|nr:DUF4214 domain-containing protein [Klebsiella aerogenes]MDG0005269.1 DUF4214 domain-containing protein [Klebsiella aerogenes]HEP1062512.1 DUF4214 domain-containing protein [Klebsiella aerogenes]